ncbi:2Fe-2S iron-sulfur cluster-binding protein [Muricoccus aerilatus]|uniref:2Fe-2S iron-sulfur cluster-binding protein n=1 Tax=Muricoccus aerilatus TaxID=452982 RepID=UPI0005C1E2CF|nr:2Fe-2S iron-sulfur cluster-binding protein [Roseomonas aerilata]
MPEIIFIQADGTRRPATAQDGESVMRAALSNDVEGIVAECGGAAACATCHVFVDDPRVPPVTPIEDEMLEATAVPREPGSRLGCQIFVSRELEGLEVRLPETQL